MNDMKRLQKSVFEEHRDYFYKIAERNTVKNELGETTISWQDESFDDDIWDNDYKENKIDL